MNRPECITKSIHEIHVTILVYPQKVTGAVVLIPDTLDIPDNLLLGHLLQAAVAQEPDTLWQLCQRQSRSPSKPIVIELWRKN